MPSGQDEVWTFTYVLEYGPATRGPSPASSVITRRPCTATPHGTAEDVVSLNFLAAWRLREKLLPDAELSDDTGDGLRPWLFGIATNALRNTSGPPFGMGGTRPAAGTAHGPPDGARLRRRTSPYASTALLPCEPVATAAVHMLQVEP
ncbi:hypothetical protein ACLB9X_08250 [Streptomyces sp. 5K101]|uniref:hypothetical protein n=1 Tax=Streptomyces sp. 5K101 TaxID=3390037 RepID=UPI003974F2BF